MTFLTLYKKISNYPLCILQVLYSLFRWQYQSSNHHYNVCVTVLGYFILCLFQIFSTRDWNIPDQPALAAKEVVEGQQDEHVRVGTHCNHHCVIMY